MFALDATLLKFFEKIAHKFQHITGKDNYWLGWAMFWLGTISAIYECFVEAWGKPTFTLVFNLSITIILQMVSQAILIYLLTKNKSNVVSTTRIRNPLEVSFTGRLLRFMAMLLF